MIRISEEHIFFLKITFIRTKFRDCAKFQVLNMIFLEICKKVKKDHILKGKTFGNTSAKG